MPPIRPDDHAYRFRPAMLRELRERLNLTQAQMAQLLEIPVNTLSRWETGANLPDANALAAIHSIAADRGVTPQFFEERRKTVSKFQYRKIRLIDWDFQNLGLEAKFISETADELDRYLNILCGQPEKLGKWAYVPATMGLHWGFGNSPQGKVLQEAGFELKPCHQNADRKIMEDGRKVFRLPPQSYSPFSPSSWSGATMPGSNEVNPKEYAYVLISDDGDYAEYLREIQRAGAETFVFGTDKCSQKLIKAVGQDHFIPLNRPYAILKGLEAVRKLKGQPTTKSEFGNLCRKALADDDWDEFPTDTGFGKQHPYARIRDYMESAGLIRIRKVGNDPNRITITEIKR